MPQACGELVEPCGSEMKIAGFIEREEPGLIHMLLRAAGLWKEPAPRAQPHESVATPLAEKITVDNDFFALNCV